jgi:hypothetical protein
MTTLTKWQVVCGQYDCTPEDYCTLCGESNDYAGYWD